MRHWSARIFAYMVLPLVMPLVSCGQQSPHSRLKDEFSGTSNFLYFDAQERQQILSDLRDMTLANYALLGIKVTRQVVTDPKALFTAAIQAEAAAADVPDSDSVGQARSNLDLLDHASRVIASFHDTHFSANAVVTNPAITNGLILVRVGGVVRVVSTYDAILEYDALHAQDGASYRRIVAGLQVTKIDGQPVDEQAKSLLPFISASSPDAADAWSVRALASRRFRIPTASIADWEFVDAKGKAFTVSLPYYYGTTTRHDAVHYLEAKGFQPLSELKLSWDESGKFWSATRSITATGYNIHTAPTSMVDATTWYSGETAGNETLRTGYIIHLGKAYGVLQVFEFSSATVTLSSASPVDTAKTRSWAAPIRDFISKLKQDGVPLIIDLRENGGGNPLNGVSLLAAIAKTDGAYAATTRALRVTPVIREMFETRDPATLPVLSSYDYDQTAYLELEAAVSRRSTYTNAFALTDTITANADVGGYDQKVVALISPNCISACDGMAILLKSSGRATLIGSHTNGTGAGFIGPAPFDTVNWRDHDQLITLNIPNRLFGLPGPIGKNVLEGDAYLTLNAENRPTVADVAYTPDLQLDYLEPASGWYAKAIEVLQAN